MSERHSPIPRLFQSKSCSCFGSYPKAVLLNVTPELYIHGLATSPSKSQIIDEFAELERKYRLYKPDLDRRELLGKEILSWAEEEPADQAVTYQSKAHQIQIGKQSQQSRIKSIFEIWKRVGSTKFLHACSLTLKAARELIPTADEEGYIVTEQTGPRRITAVVSLKKAGAGA